MDVSPFSLPQTIDASRPCRAHLVGIAGSGMRALADVLLAWHWTLTGSDLNLDGFLPLTAANIPARNADIPVACVNTPLSGADIPVCHSDFDPPRSPKHPPHQRIRLFPGHAAEHLSPETNLLIYSDAVPADNPELRRALELGIPALSYFQMLGRLAAGRHTIAVAGTHGKSSTAAMTTHILVESGLDLTAVFGATPLGQTSGGRAGLAVSSLPLGEGTTPDNFAVPGQIVLLEACEYRANFLHLRPQQAAILGIEPDHFDCYGSLAELEDAFRRFAEFVPPAGFLVARHDCDSTRRVTSALKCCVESFGLSPAADWSARKLEQHLGRFRFDILRFGRPLCSVQLTVPGEHNVLNALAAAALAYQNGLSAEQIAAGLGRFPGLHRRLEQLGTWRGAALIDDYAHHPTEVTAALAAVRRMYPNAKVWVVFQPHQASRTARLLDELAASLQNADKVLVAQIFRAREGKPPPGEVTAADLAQRTAELGANVLHTRTDKEIAELLATQLAPGDVLVTLGAGNVGNFQPVADGIARQE
jgi:UDP-N-acetylmuramate--alanine ligase